MTKPLILYDDMYDKSVIYMEDSCGAAPEDLNEKGMEHFGNEDIRTALRNFKMAKNAAKRSSDDSEKARSYHNLGLLYSIKKDNYFTSKEYFKQAIDIREDLDENTELSESYYHLGLTYERLGKLEEAIDSFDRAAELKEDIDDKGQMAKILAYIGNLYQLKDNEENAKRYHKQSIDVMKELKDGNPFPIGLFTLISNINKEELDHEELMDYYKDEVHLPEELDLPINLDLLVNKGRAENRVYQSS